MIERKVGDKVYIKSIEWYYRNKTRNGSIPLQHPIWDGNNPINADPLTERYGASFVEAMAQFCGKQVTITDVIEHTITGRPLYYIAEDARLFYWAEWMFEDGVINKQYLLEGI